MAIKAYFKPRKLHKELLFKEWMIAILSVTKTDAVVQGVKERWNK